MCMGRDQMLIISTANMLGNDTHRQICALWSAKINLGEETRPLQNAEIS